MIEYEIEMSRERHPVPVARFKDKAYELVGTFLLAEARSFGEEIAEALDEVCAGGKESGAFSGNAFSLEISRNVTVIADDIMGRECEIDTRELRSIVDAYRRSCRRENA